MLGNPGAVPRRAKMLFHRPETGPRLPAALLLAVAALALEARGAAQGPAAASPQELPPQENPALEVPALVIVVQRRGPAGLAIELEIPEPAGGASAAPRRLVFPSHLPRAIVRGLEIDGAPIAEPLEARAAEASSGEHAFALELPPRGAVRVRYELAPAPLALSLEHVRAARAAEPRAPTTLLVGPESILIAGSSPFARVEGVERTLVGFELGPAAAAFPPLDERGAVELREHDEVLFAFGPWRREEHPQATLLLPAEGLLLDPQGRAFDEAHARALRLLLAHPPAPLARALSARPKIALLPIPPLAPSPHLLYLGGRTLSLSAGLWRISAESCGDLAQLSELATKDHPALRELATRDAALAAAFASALAIDSLPAAQRARALRRALPSTPLRAEAKERARWAILALLERHGSPLAEECCEAAASAPLELDRAWRAALRARGASELAAFDALAAGRALLSIERLGGPWAVREEAEARELGLHRLASGHAHAIRSTSELSSAERAALRDLVARMALELSWPLERRATRWPALAADAVQLDERGELAISLGALYDAEAGWADELRAGEPVRRMLVGGSVQYGSGRATQVSSWRRGDLALSFELELRGVEPPRDAAHERERADDPIAFVRAHRDGPSLELRLRGLPPCEEERERRELRYLFVAALQAAPGDPGDPAVQRSVARPLRAGASAPRAFPRELALDDGAETTPPGYSGTPLAERAGFGFQRWDAERGQWAPAAFELDQHDELRHPEEAAIHARLLERFLAGLEWPMPYVEGVEPLVGGDDLPFRAGHDAGHDALDLGARLCASAASEALHYPSGTAVYSPHRDARRWPHPAGYPVIAVELREGDYRLRVRLDLIHVRPTREWNEFDPQARLPARATIGELHAYDASSPWGGWITTDPALRLRGTSKGNHVHLATAGLFETRSADPRRNERKTAFLRAQILPALEAAYARAPRFPGELVRAVSSSARAPRIADEAPGFHALFDGIEHASALALAGYDAEQQPQEHAWFAAAMRARVRAARPLRDAETGELRPLWSDGWLSRDASGALVQRVETPIEVSGARYRLRLAVRYRGVDSESAPLGAISPETRLARNAAREELGAELLGFDADLAAARRIAALGASPR
ncbi:MAG: hypothetical protein IPN34_07345 [Planctomycetes bacterium]|nr:hypothetical protein [Planctomycetota bacterium]